MKEIIADVLDFRVPTLVYETVEEGDQAAGRTGAVLDECNKNLQYRGSNADARDLIVTVASELSGLTPNTKTEKRGDKDVEVVDEKEGVFVERVLASGKATKEAIQAEVESRARNGWSYKDGEQTIQVGPIAVDIKARERKPKLPPKLAGHFKTAAKTLLAKADDSTINKSLAKYLPKEQASFARTGDEAKDIETLGWLVRAHSEAKLAAGVL